MEEYKKKLVSERRTLNAEKLKIPARIDECVKIAAGLRETDFDALGAELVELEAERDGLNGELVRIRNDSAVQVKESELVAVRGEADNLEMRNRLHRQSQANTSDAAKVNAWKLRLSAAETEERMLVGQISGAEVRAERLERQIEGLNVSDEDLYMPIEDAKAHLSEVCFTIPYSRAVKQQMLDGKLYQPVNDKKFNDKFKAITEKVV